MVTAKVTRGILQVKGPISPDLREKLILDLDWLRKEKAVVELIGSSHMIGRERRNIIFFLGIPTTLPEYLRQD